jgi:hypothetical protein
MNKCLDKSIIFRLRYVLVAIASTISVVAVCPCEEKPRAASRNFSGKFEWCFHLGCNTHLLKPIAIIFRLCILSPMVFGEIRPAAL